MNTFMVVIIDFEFAGPKLVEETGYDRQQTSKIKTVVLQRYVESSLMVQNPLFPVHKLTE